MGDSTANNLQRSVSGTVLCTLIALVLLASGCSGSDTDVVSETEQAQFEEAAPATDTAPARDDHTGLPEAPAAVQPSPASAEEVAGALDVEPAPLGTILVAKPAAGVPLLSPPSGMQEPVFEIPVFDEPFGELRVLVHRSVADGAATRHPLLHQGGDGSPLVLRVVAGEPGDEWVQVQAPVAPLDQTVWVQSQYFEFESTTVRVEIDLANAGSLQVIDGGSIVLDTPVVQGRDEFPTPHHVTYVEGGQAGAQTNGYAQTWLSLASYGGKALLPDGAARVFVHPNEQPRLLGHAISLGSVRVSPEAFDELVSWVEPGTPVMIFSGPWGRDAVVSAAAMPAETAAFDNDELLVGPSAIHGSNPLWQS